MQEEPIIDPPCLGVKAHSSTPIQGSSHRGSLSVHGQNQAAENRNFLAFRSISCCSVRLDGLDMMRFSDGVWQLVHSMNTQHLRQ